MTLTSDGLRKRSPNPNLSPHLDDPDRDLRQTAQPYSPGLLSPYAQDDSQGQSANYSPFAERSPVTAHTPFGGITPTIRLIPTSSRSNSDTSPIPPTLNSRSRSDDRQFAGSPASVLTADLHRHATEPPYSHLDRGEPREAFLFSRHPNDKPVPPLPLHIRRESSLRSIESRISIGKSELDNDDRESADAASAGTGRRTWSSLLVNPFKQHRDPERTASNGSSSKLRRLQALSRPMLRSSSSASTNATLPDSDPVDVNPYKKAAALEKTISATSIDSEILERVRSAGGDKITAKFPERVETEDKAWTSFKIVLLMSVLTLFGYGLAGLCWSLQVMLRIKQSSEVTMVSDPDVVIFLLFFSLLSLFTSFVGLTGTLLSSRPILAFYNLLLWPTFISLALVGYTSFKRGNLQLDRKLNQVWSQFLTDEDRLRIQNELGCCGYYNPFHDATYSKKCYPRTSLPGCKGKWTEYEAQSLRNFATAAFSTVPIHLVNIVVALICSNHVDQQFGKGLTPIKYRLQMADVRANAMAILSALPPEPSRQISSVSLLKRSSALRTSRPPSRSNPSTVSLVPHKRQYSVDSHFYEKHGQSPDTPFSEQRDGLADSARRPGDADFGLPHLPNSRLSSLNIGKWSTQRTQAHDRDGELKHEGR